MVVFQQIPAVSLKEWNGPDGDQRDFAERLRDICHEVGFFRLVDHGVDPSFMSEYFAALKTFFGLPEETKSRIDKSRSRWFRGWERVGAELTDARVDYREQVDIWSDLPPHPRQVLPEYLRLEGPNQWLEDDVLPGFREVVERFEIEMSRIGDELMEAMSLGLGLERDHLGKRFGDRRMSLIKLIHYPPTPNGEAGVNSHHDTGFLTLLWQNEIGGLQVENPNGEWIDVPVEGDAIIVNIGEMLQSMTGNYFVATTHRVVATEERYSSAYFHGPELSADLSPLPLDGRFAKAVEASRRHRHAGFMASYDELQEGPKGTTSESSETYGQQIWNYFVRSYPNLVAQHYPDLFSTTDSAQIAAGAARPAKTLMSELPPAGVDTNVSEALAKIRASERY